MDQPDKPKHDKPFILPPASEISDIPLAEYRKFERETTDEQHAVYAVCSSLKSLGLSDWTNRIVELMGRLDGCIYHVEIWESPFICLPQILAECSIKRVVAHKTPLEIKKSIARSIADMEMFHKRYVFRNRTTDLDYSWNFMDEKWLDFLDRATLETDHLHIWFTEQPYPSIHEIYCWLLEEPYRVEDDPLPAPLIENTMGSNSRRNNPAAP